MKVGISNWNHHTIHVVELAVMEKMYTFFFLIRVVYFNCLYTVWTGVYIDILMCKSNASLHSFTSLQDFNHGTTTQSHPTPLYFPFPMICKPQKPSIKYTAKLVNIKIHTVSQSTQMFYLMPDINQHMIRNFEATRIYLLNVWG